MTTPKHGSIASAELKSMDTNAQGMSNLNAGKYTNYLIAASVRSVKKDKVELVTDIESAYKWIEGLDEPAVGALARIYSWLNDSSEYEELLKNLGITDTSRSTRTR